MYISLSINIYKNQRGSDELLSQAAVMAPASDNNNQDLATKKAKLDSSTVLAGGIGKSCKFLPLSSSILLHCFALDFPTLYLAVST